MSEELKFNLENAKAQMRKGILEYCILLIISRDKIYASDLLNKLKDANLIVVEGTIYPLLSRLKNMGLLDYSWEESKAGPPRKYYRLTAKGEETMKALKTVWQSLNKSINSLTK